MNSFYTGYPEGVIPHWPMPPTVFPSYTGSGPLVRSSSGHQVTTDRDKFQICIDMHQFTSNEICVKTVGDHIVVEGKHEEKEADHGSFVSRHFVRKYPLPRDHLAADVVSSFSSDGVLTITAPKHKAPIEGERVVPIVPVGQVHPKTTNGVKKEED